MRTSGRFELLRRTSAFYQALGFAPSHDASEPVLPSHREAAARRRGGALAQAARARGHGPQGRGGPVELAPGRLARAAEGDADRARGTERDRRAGDADAALEPGRDLAALGALQDR